MGVHQLKDGRWFVQYKQDGKVKREYYGRGPAAETKARQRNTARIWTEFLIIAFKIEKNTRAH